MLRCMGGRELVFVMLIKNNVFSFHLYTEFDYFPTIRFHLHIHNAVLLQFQGHMLTSQKVS